MKALLAVPAMLIAMNATAACPGQRPTDMPQMPVAESASQQEMAEAQMATQAYVDSVSVFLECRAAHLSDQEHNLFVNSAESVAAQYNQTLFAYQQRESIAKN
jgi:hypothetical protein